MNRARLGAAISTTLVAIVATGCFGRLPSIQPSHTPAPSSTSITEVAAVPNYTETPPLGNALEPTTTSGSMMTLEVSDLPKPTPTGSLRFGGLGFSLGDPNLKSSDIQAIDLEDGGKPKVVEFFAYW